MNTINGALARTDWKLLAQQKQALVRLLSEPERLSNSEWDNLKGLLRWIDAIQDAAEAEGYPVVFLAEPAVERRQDDEFDDNVNGASR